MGIKVLRYTEKPLEHIGEVAGICWGSPLGDPIKNRNRAIECIDNGHGRTMEFADIEFVIEGYSARVIREFYTHVIGTSRLQESTRYVNCNYFNYYTPNKIYRNEEANDIYAGVMQDICDAYDKLMELGMTKEDVANILPLGMDTKVVVKLNLRALLHMAEVRTCTRAYVEFRELMREIKEVISLLDEDWKYISEKYIVPKCETLGYCNERYCCGRRPKKSEITIMK